MSSIGIKKYPFGTHSVENLSGPFLILRWTFTLEKSGWLSFRPLSALYQIEKQQNKKKYLAISEESLINPPQPKTSSAKALNGIIKKPRHPMNKFMDEALALTTINNTFFTFFCLLQNYYFRCLE